MLLHSGNILMALSQYTLMIPHVLKSIMLIFRTYIMQNNLWNMTTPPQWKLVVLKIEALADLPSTNKQSNLSINDLK